MTSALFAILATLPTFADVSPRRVYVVHSGVHTILANRDKNQAAKQLRRALLERGVADRDIVVMSNPFPTASWKSMFPKKLAVMFALYASPTTDLSQKRYLQLDQALRSHNVSPRDEVVWIGHSAGGQIGITMAHLAKNLKKYPKLAAKARPYRIETVVTLGTPIATNLTPPDAKLRCYYSPADTTVSWVVQYGPFVLWGLGHNLGIWATPPAIGDDFKMRIFRLVAHPNWCVDRRVLNCLMSELQPRPKLPWHMYLIAPDDGLSLMGLIYQTLDTQCHMSLQDPPWAWRQRASAQR